MKVFISGPVSGVENYERVFEVAESLLTAEGHEVCNPAREFRKWTDYEDIMKACLKRIAASDVVVMLPGWQQSRGANREYGFALGRGIKIVPLYDREGRERSCLQN